MKLSFDYNDPISSNNGLIIIFNVYINKIIYHMIACQPKNIVHGVIQHVFDMSVCAI